MSDYESYFYTPDEGQNLDVVDLGGGEEYFVEDRDQVYCKHGSYIGYPGGPDYICGPCEDGLDTLLTGVQVTLYYRIRINQDDTWSGWLQLDRVYSIPAIYQFQVWFDLFSSPSIVMEIETEIFFDTYEYWGTDDTSD